jgi:hypothetical protein
LDFSTVNFVNADTRVTAALSEFSKVGAPLPGLSGIYIRFDEEVLEYDTSRKIATLNESEDGLPDAHTYEADFAEGPPLGDSYSDPRNWSDDRDDKEEAIQRVEALSAAYASARRVAPNIDMGKEVEEASKGRAYDPRPPETRRQVQHVVVPLMTFPGYPTLLVPTQPTQYPTPFTLEGVIDGNIGEMTKGTLRVSIPDAWSIESFMNSVDYHMEYDIEGEPVGAQEFTYGHTSKEVWPIVYEPEKCRARIVFTGQERAAGNKLSLPPVHSHYMRDQKIVYKYEILTRGVTDVPYSMKHNIQDYGGVTNYHGVVPTTSATYADHIRDMRGFFVRGPMDFRFAPYVKAGVIPSTSEAEATEGAAATEHQEHAGDADAA